MQMMKTNRAIIVMGLVILFFATCKKDENSIQLTQVDSIQDIDGNTYKTVTIGKQIWMASNLKTTKYNDGTAIPLVTDETAWIHSTPGYCWYENDSVTNKSTYGALYNWYTVKTGKLCPTGWHVPTEPEWTTLAPTFWAGQLKEIGTSHWADPNFMASNTTGFTALPGGYRISYGSFGSIGEIGCWWSSTEDTSLLAWYRYMYYYSGNFRVISTNKQYGFSVRCLKD